MAFKNVGNSVTLGPGQSIRWGYAFDNFADMGVQTAGAFPVLVGPGSLGVALATDQTIVVQGINQVSYEVTITNISPNFLLRHNLQGGGVS